MKYLLVVISFGMIFSAMSAQKVVFSTTVAHDTTDNVKPPTHTLRLFVEGSAMISTTPSESQMAKQVSGMNFNIGLTYNHRYIPQAAYGFELAMKTRKYNMLKDSSKIFPDSILHEKEYLLVSGFEVVAYHRFYFFLKRHKNAQGPVFDIGVFGHWNGSSYHYTKDKNAESSMYGYTTAMQYHPKYIHAFDAGGMVRFGINHYLIFAQYRLTDLLEPSYRKAPYNFTSLSRLEVGIRLGL